MKEKKNVTKTTLSSQKEKKKINSVEVMGIKASV